MLLSRLTLLVPLLLTTVQFTNAYPGHFGIIVHLPVEGDCERWREVISETISIKEGHCKNFPPFRAFRYQWGMYRKTEENPYRHGICGVKVYGGLDCQGEEILHITNGNGWDEIGYCWGLREGAFNKTAGRSIAVERCRKIDRKNSPWPKARKPDDTP